MNSLTSIFIRCKFLSLVFNAYIDKKSFQHFPHANVLGCKFDLALKKIKGQPTPIIWTNLVELESSMPYTNNQPQSFLGSGEDDFEVFPAKFMINAMILILRL